MGGKKICLEMYVCIHIFKYLLQAFMYYPSLQSEHNSKIRFLQLNNALCLQKIQHGITVVYACVGKSLLWVHEYIGTN